MQHEDNNEAEGRAMDNKAQRRKFVVESINITSMGQFGSFASKHGGWFEQPLCCFGSPHPDPLLC